MVRVPERVSNVGHDCAIRLFCRNGKVQLFDRHALDIRKVLEGPPKQLIDVEVRYEIGTKNWNQTPREVMYEIGALIAFVVMTLFIALGFLLIFILHPL